MTALLEEIENFSRKTADSNRERLQILSPKARTGKVEWLRNSFFHAPAQAITLYELARVAAQSAERPNVGVHVWKETRDRFSSLLKDWEDIEKLGDPIIDFLVSHYCQILRELVAAAEAEYRAYKETAFLLCSPQNAERLEAALKEARSGKLPKFGSGEEALRSLRAK
jgi:hypothetical protein